MAKRSDSGSSGVPEIDGIDIQDSGQYTEPEQSKKWMLQSKFPALIRETGPVTGKQYEWPNAGSVVEVDELDFPLLKVKRMGSHLCCGSDNYLFIEV
jgi:hypothetical protein